jgi:hypothetical protein
MNDKALLRRGRAIAAWLGTLAVAAAFALSGVCCNRDVPLGVDPKSDAAPQGAADAGTDGG